MTTPVAFVRHGPTTDHQPVQPRIRFLDGRITGRAQVFSKKSGSKAWITGVFLAAAGLAGCAAEPFVDGRREAGSTRTVGRSSASVVAICYNSRSTTPQVVWEMAESECAKTDRVPRYDREDVLACSVANPTRIYFRCVRPQG